MSQDVYAKITARIVSALRDGVVPWHQPWHAEQGQPRNLLSGTPYRGINVWLLSGHGGSPFWLTYRHAVQIGGHVNKGATGSPVIFWKVLARTGGEQDSDEAGAPECNERGGYALARGCLCRRRPRRSGRRIICSAPKPSLSRSRVVGMLSSLSSSNLFEFS